MSSTQKKVNIPDILIGVVLLAGIPLMTFALLSAKQDKPGAAAAGDRKVLPLTAGELDELKGEYARMYSQNARLFILRAGDSKDQVQEQYWARQVLERCRKGFADLEARVRVSPSLQGSLLEIERYLHDIDLDLKMLPPASPGGRPPLPPPAGAAPP